MTTNTLTNEELTAIVNNVDITDSMYYITKDRKVSLSDFSVYTEDAFDPIDIDIGIGDIKGALYAWYMNRYDLDRAYTLVKATLVHKFDEDDHRGYQELFDQEFLGYCKFYKTKNGYNINIWVDYFGVDMNFDAQGYFHSAHGAAYSDYGPDSSFSIYAKHGRLIEHLPSVSCPTIDKYMFESGLVSDYQIHTDICVFEDVNDDSHCKYYPVSDFPELNGIYFTVNDDGDDADFCVLCDRRSGEPKPIKVY